MCVVLVRSVTAAERLPLDGVVPVELVAVSGVTVHRRGERVLVLGVVVRCLELLARRLLDVVREPQRRELRAQPVEAAARIASLCEVEGAGYLPSGMTRPPGTDTGALAYAAVTLAATHAEIAAIACYTRTGRTARILASLRPRVPIIAFTPDPAVGSRLALVNGVVPRLSVALDESDRLGRLSELLDETRLLGDGATVVVVSSTATPGSAPNLLGIQRVTVT